MPLTNRNEYADDSLPIKSKYILMKKLNNVKQKIYPSDDVMIHAKHKEALNTGLW